MDISTSVDVWETDTFKLTGRLTAPEVYVDGWSQLLVGMPIPKIVFHSMVEPQGANPKETRRVAATLSINTFLAIQLAQAILAGCKANEGQVVGAGEEFVRQLRNSLAQQTVVNAPAGVEVAPNAATS